LLGSLHTHAQEYYKEHPQAMEIFNRLNDMFPRRYLIHRNLPNSFYHLEYYFNDEEDYNRHQAALKRIINDLKSIKATRIMSDIVDSAHVQSEKYTLTLNASIMGQSDKLHLDFNRERVIFHYEARNIMVRDRFLPVQNPDVIEEAETLFHKYITRKRVTKRNVTYYDGINYIRSVWDWNYHPGNWHREITRGTRYVVPNCTEKDFELFRKQFRKYIKKDHCNLTENDVYWQFEQSCLWMILPDMTSLSFCAALRGNDLYLLRTESEKNKGILPRAWATEDLIWNAKNLNHPSFLNK
jgi:hypothetical protein